MKYKTPFLPEGRFLFGALKAKGLIDYSRGVITILDPRGLEENACECYGVIKGHLKNFAEFDTPITE